MARIKPQWGWADSDDLDTVELLPLNGMNPVSTFARLLLAARQIKAAIYSPRVTEESRTRIRNNLCTFVSELNECCRMYLHFRTESKTLPTIGEVDAALRSAARDIERGKPFPSNMDYQSLRFVRDVLASEDCWRIDDCIRAFTEDSAKRSCVLRESKARREDCQSGGAPRNTTRIAFAADIGAILRRNNITLTRSTRRKRGDEKSGKGGTFYRILNALFIMMGDEVFDLDPPIGNAIRYLDKNREFSRLYISSPSLP